MELLDLMEQHERLLAKLYESYSELFPEHKDFWQQIAQEELMHALWLVNFQDKHAEGTLRYKDTTVRIEAIKLSIEYVQKQVDIAHAGGIDHLYALSVANDLETALLEQLPFDIAESISPMFRALLDKLASQSQHHQSRVSFEFKKHRDKGTGS